MKPATYAGGEPRRAPRIHPAAYTCARCGQADLQKRIEEDLRSLLSVGFYLLALVGAAALAITFA